MVSVIWGMRKVVMKFDHIIEYRKPPNISHELIVVCKHFWIGLHIVGGLYTDV
jgi:hypothetical protein